ncbi:MAG: sulfotransferase [Pseudomonadota bacterium]
MANAVRAYQEQRFTDAAQICRRLLQAGERAEVLHLLGLAQLGLKEDAAASETLKRAAALAPGDSAIARNLGLALRQQGQLRAALESWAGIANADPALRYQRGALALELHDDAAAEADWRAVLRKDPQHAAAGAGLAHLALERNQPEQALALADTVLAHAPDHAQAALARGRALAQLKQPAEAQAVFERLGSSAAVAPANRALALGQLARLYDRQAQWDDAFQAATQANQTLAATPAFQQARGTSVYALDVIDALTGALSEDRLRAWAAETPQDGPEPTFLVGFPRSGTTLADRMLGAHTDIAVVEEQPTLHELLARTAGSGLNLEPFGVDERATLRSAYRRRAEAAAGGPAPVILDKLPLNLGFVAPIWRLFPRARFILALRDPRDVVLSCYLQTFGANDAMSHFLNLPDAVRYYAAVLRLGLRCLRTLPVRFAELRYESLVQDPEAQVRRLLTFLDLSWQAPMADYRAGLRGQRINTPSFDQVSEPIYQRARGRWRHYRKHLREVLPALNDLGLELGYDADP